MKKLSAAIIGVGAMGKNHARVYSELDGVKLAAVADVDESTAADVSGKYGCSYHTDYLRLLEEEEIDLASVVVPTSLHSQVGIDCVGHGLNVLVEKPIADNVQSAERLVDASVKAGVLLCVGHVERFNPAVIELKRRLLADELGSVFKVSVKRVGPFPRRVRDVGVIVDFATHDLDVVQHLVGSPVERVFAEAERRIHASHEDMLTAVLKFRNGVVGLLDVNWLTPEKKRKLSVVGEKGMFVLNYMTQELFFCGAGESSFGDVEGSTSVEGFMKIPVIKAEPLKAEIQAFVDCVRGKSCSTVSGGEAVAALRLADSLIESSRCNKVVCP